jgi:hypothetical protein
LGCGRRREPRAQSAATTGTSRESESGPRGWLPKSSEDARHWRLFQAEGCPARSAHRGEQYLAPKPRVPRQRSGQVPLPQRLAVADCLQRDRLDARTRSRARTCAGVTLSLEHHGPQSHTPQRFCLIFARQRIVQTGHSVGPHGGALNTGRRDEGYEWPSRAIGNAACQHSSIQAADTNVHLGTRQSGEASWPRFYPTHRSRSITPLIPTHSSRAWVSHTSVWR